ncbi:MAG: 23S rRNA (adenine(2503)-C(2))-methyltransferase RlmN [bacterium]|nr:23S rRNA (adenine(2503)-C(2))-methyltransferase RlmN [bacterium]
MIQPPLIHLLGLPRRRLAEVLAPLIDQRYRIEQVYRALYERGVGDFAEMTDLSKALRTRLAEHFTIRLPEIVSRRRSADGTVKVLLRLADGTTIEAVDIPEPQRRTICVSTQAGCALGCRFCVTGHGGAGRDLSAGEMIAQVMALSGTDVAGLHLVFMGMGEPLLNLDNLADALEILFERISWRRITVSTAGVIPGIEAMARWPRRPQLAISLHAPDDARRSALMPINRRYPLADLLAALERYPLAPNERLTFEYLLIRDFNDAFADADALVRLLRKQRAKVNLIPCNSDPVLDPEMRSPSPQRVDAFRRRLVEQGLAATRRERRGADVGAACGQLRVQP